MHRRVRIQPRKTVSVIQLQLQQFYKAKFIQYFKFHLFAFLSNKECFSKSSHDDLPNIHML